MRTAARMLVLLGALASCTRTSTALPRPPASPHVGDCASATDSSVPPDWYADAAKDSVTVGPVMFHNLKTFRSSPDRPNELGASIGSDPYVDPFAVVEAGRTVTLSIPNVDRGQVAFLYGARYTGEGRYRVSDGLTEVQFKACSDRASVYTGGLVLVGARCVAFDVFVDDGSYANVRAPIGIASC